MKWIITILVVLLFGTSCAPGIPDNTADLMKYGVFIGADEEKLFSLKDYDILIVDAENLTKQGVDRIHKNGNKLIYSYLNIGSVEEFRSYYDDFLSLTIGEYENWDDEKWIDISSEGWQKHISETADRMIEKGIDGIFADNSDIYYCFHEPKIYNSLIEIFNTFSEKNIKVIVNGGDVFISEAIENGSIPACIYAVNQENVFTSTNFDEKTFGENNSEVRDYYFEYLDACADNGLDVFLIEYGASDNLTAEITAYCKKNEFACYFAKSLALD